MSTYFYSVSNELKVMGGDAKCDCSPQVLYDGLKSNIPGNRGGDILSAGFLLIRLFLFFVRHSAGSLFSWLVKYSPMINLSCNVFAVGYIFEKVNFFFPKVQPA
mmetsp:Transcript_16135/g.22524  ORF Transcript_16135/g.22524 Transcript_16135/m.22524 type:complete len:104 (-) Transcript_16135:411-722(-)